jgi:bla regulator protein blaR1
MEESRMMASRNGQWLSGAPRALLRSAGVALLVIGSINSPAIRAQSTSESDSAPQKFEVASIKPSGPDDHEPESNSPSGSINWNNTVRSLILAAYQLQGYQLARDPKWLNSEYYRIIAKPPAGPLPANERTRMDQTSERFRYLLAERFQLTTHEETRNLKEYFLVVAKGGPNLKEVTRGDTVFAVRTPKGKIVTKGGAKIGLLVSLLAIRLSCPVIDKTGLNPDQLYDIQLNYAPDDTPSDTVPPLFSALQEQLGLKLEAGKGPVKVLVIDHVERPSAN